jgi:hypothetical protein
MKDFKSTEKTVCFKEGGQVTYKPRKQYKDDGDISQDKAIVKKGVSQHEAKLHKGQPKTELKLKNGGRAKKAGGCVGRYKAGGTVENAYGTPKTDKDIKDIANTKRQKPKKMQMGGMTAPAAAGPAAAAPSAASGQGQMSELEKRRMMEKMERAKKYLSPSQQSELIKQSPAAAGLTGGGYKKGGCITKMKDGGSLKETNAEENPGLAKLPTNVRNKMGYAKKGGKVC